MSKYIHPLTKEAAWYVANNLRDDDRRELEEGHGLPALSCAIYPLEHDSVYFEVPNGETAGMAGVGEDGLIWMLCTPAIHKYPHPLQEKQRGLLTVVRSLCSTTLLTVEIQLIQNSFNGSGSSL